MTPRWEWLTAEDGIDHAFPAGSRIPRSACGRTFLLDQVPGDVWRRCPKCELRLSVDPTFQAVDTPTEQDDPDQP